MLADSRRSLGNWSENRYGDNRTVLREFQASQASIRAATHETSNNSRCTWSIGYAAVWHRAIRLELRTTKSLDSIGIEYDA